MSTTTRAGYGSNRGALPEAPVGPHVAIMNNPRYQELVRSRNGLAWTLSIAVLAIYLGFIFLVAFDKPLLATKVSGTTTLGIVLGVVVIVLAFLLTAIYVVRANGRFDELTDEIKREAVR
ncbi:MAG: DUF485 domain-containing protein [Acetobacteraceae bacterium]|nr:DUF485 domain-containing protein [Acetobacteraceae bacterium]